MKKNLFLLLLVTTVLIVQSCGFYSFTGASVAPNIKTFQVNFFRNNAPIVEPGIDRLFTQTLQDLIVNQTSLDLTNQNADLIYEGEIVQYYIAPITATAQNTAAQNRLTIAVNVRFLTLKMKETIWNNVLRSTLIMVVQLNLQDHSAMKPLL